MMGEIERISLGDGRLLVRTTWGGWVETPTINIDVAVGAIRDGIIEPWTTRLVQELLRPGQTYFNSGANFGYYVALAGQIVGDKGRVFAVEPNPYILPYLIRTVYWSGIIGRVKIFDVALGQENREEADFSFDPQFLGAGTLDDVLEPQIERAHEAQDFASCLWSGTTIRRRFNATHEFEPYLQTMVRYKAAVRSIDHLCGDAALDLLHLDIEGNEAMALLGARKTLARSPQARLITEWSAAHYREGAARAAFDEAWRLLHSLGFRVRRLEPRLADNGGIFIAAPLSFEDMTQRATHGDYVWLRAEHDPWP